LDELVEFGIFFIFCKVNFFRAKNFLFQKTKESFGGKKFTLQMKA
jgi:hypothetical protein